MNDNEKLEVNPSAVYKFWLANKRWIYPTVVGIFALLGGNVDRIDEWLPPVTDSNLTPRVVTLENKTNELEKFVGDLDSRVNTLTKVIAAHENKLFPQGQSDQPVFRE